MNEWTVMVYMAGDNDLSDDMVSSLTRIREQMLLKKNDKVEFFAYYDALATGFPSLLFDFSKTQPEELNFEIRTSTASIFSFVEWCARHNVDNSDRNYALILSGHGDGFQKKSFLNDESSEGYVTISSLGKVLKKINSEILGQDLNILALDSCVMSSVEFAYEIGAAARMLVASQGYVPFSGWDYGRIVSQLATKTGSISDSDMVDVMMSSFIESYQPFKDYNGLSVEIASCDLAKIKDLVGSIYALAEKLILYLRSADEEVRKGIERAILYSHHRCQTYLLEQCIDLRDFLQIFQGEVKTDGISEACQRAIDQIGYCVKSKSIGSEFQFSSGLSLFFPWSYFSYLVTRNQYLALDFGMGQDERTLEHTNEPSPWTSFLDTYLFSTLRDSADHTLKASLIGSHRGNGNAAGDADVDGNELIEEHRVNPLNTRVNPLNTRVNPLNTRVLARTQIENFRRTKNFPWLPKPAIERLFHEKEDRRAVGKGR